MEISLLTAIRLESWPHYPDSMPEQIGALGITVLTGLRKVVGFDVVKLLIFNLNILQGLGHLYGILVT